MITKVGLVRPTIVKSFLEAKSVREFSLFDPMESILPPYNYYIINTIDDAIEWAEHFLKDIEKTFPELVEERIQDIIKTFEFIENEPY